MKGKRNSKRPVKTGEVQDGERNNRGQFKPGVSGNPKGRPEGSRNKATLAVQDLLLADGERVASKAVELALGGNETALRLVLERLVPPAKERAIALELPKLSKPSDVADAVRCALEAVAGGEITPGEASVVLKLLESLRAALREKVGDKESERLDSVLGRDWRVDDE